MLQTFCIKCQSRKSVYCRQYSGEILCKKCFLSSIEDKTRKTISKYSMLRHDDRVAVAVSGGKDSLSLLYIMKSIFETCHRADPIAITIDEGIKNYRDESLEIVKRFCADLRIEIKIVSYQELFGRDMDQAILERPSKKLSSCSVCGTFRRRAIDLAAESVGANVVATAHNLDDQLQTFMINMIAGDVQRIGWTHPESVTDKFHTLRKIKPFCEIYEQEIVLYALLREIPFQTEDCPYMNESIRTQIRKFLNVLEKERPGIKYNLYGSVLKISNNLKTFPNHSDPKKCATCGRTSTSGICSVCKTLSVLKGNEMIPSSTR
jgi:cytoplasmic tRNA 2-thiolation protein 1